MILRIVLGVDAQRDLDGIHAFIAERSGTRVADGYVKRLQQRLASLSHTPEQGSRREELGRGVRVIGFEKRVTIPFVVSADKVTILRLLYGGQSLDLPPGLDAD